MAACRQRALRIGLALGAALTSPAVHARIGPSIRELVEIRDIEALSLSPDGRRLAFRVQTPSVSANTYRIDWYVAEVQAGRIRHVADGGEPIYNDGEIESDPPVWSPDSRSLYRRALVDGAIGVWRTAADGSGSSLVVGGPADVESLAAAPDGRTLSYVTGPARAEIRAAERKEYDDGILIDASIDPLETLYRGGWVGGRLASDRLKGEWYSRGGLLWRKPRTRHRLDLVTSRELGSETLAVPKIGVMATDSPTGAISARSGSGEMAKVVGAGAEQHLEVDASTEKTIVCDSGPCRGSKIVALAWRPGTDQLLFTRQDENFRQTLYLWDSGSGEVRRVAGGDGQLSGGRSGALPCAVARTAAVCVEAGPISPPRLVRISLDDGRQAILLDPNRNLRLRPAPQVEQIVFPIAGGRTASGTLLYPPGPLPVRAPLFVTYYVCPGYLRGGTGDPYPLEPLVNSGFVVACLNIVPFQLWGDGPDRDRDALASVTGLVRMLDRRGWIDPARVGMGGFSMGSEATMWVAMNSSLLSAAAVASPQYEPSAYWMESVRGRDVPAVMKKFQGAGPPDQDPGRWKIISPALNTEGIKAPLLMQLPEQEFRGSMELYSKLTHTTTPVEMYAFPDEAHLKIQPRHQFAVYRRNLDWFRYWLQNSRESDPALAPQYERWDLLRRRRTASSE